MHNYFNVLIHVLYICDQELNELRREKSQLEESVHQLSTASDGARQTVARLVNQLDQERRQVVQHVTNCDVLKQVRQLVKCEVIN